MTTQALGIEICKILYDNLNEVYPALTGGALYKDGERKDIDIVLYGKRENPPLEIVAIEQDLKKLGFTNFRHFGFVTKCDFGEVNIDFICPETGIISDYEANSESDNIDF